MIDSTDSILSNHIILYMKKTYVGSPNLHLNFKMFRIKYENSYEAERIKEEIMGRMNEYLKKYDGRLINVK